MQATVWMNIKKRSWKKPHMRVYSALLHLHEVLEQIKLIYARKNQNNAYIWGGRGRD